MSDTRITLDGNTLHVHHADDNNYEVWLNTEGDFDGLCIGCGATEDVAIKQAEDLMVDAATALQKRRKQ